MSTSKETVLNVTGMSCGPCVRHVEAALRTVIGITTVSVSLEDGKVRVRHDGRTTAGAMVEALAGAGYEARAAEV